MLYLFSCECRTKIELLCELVRKCTENRQAYQAAKAAGEPYSVLDAPYRAMYQSYSKLYKAWFSTVDIPSDVRALLRKENRMQLAMYGIFV